jgi:leucyl aminopeptidase (aminopeptidase T)
MRGIAPDTIAVLAAGILLLACRDSVPPAGDVTARTSEGAATAPAPAADFRSIAEKVVAQSAGVQENEVVELFGSAEDLPLLNELSIEVRKRGAHPLVLIGDDKTSRRMFDEVPAKYDTQEPRAVLGLVRMIDVVIGTEFGEGRTFKGASPERQAAQAKTFQPVFRAMQQRGVRAVTLGNGLYPTAERAEHFGVSRDELAKIMYGGIDTDYEQLARTGEALRAALASGKELRITAPSGTDLRVPIAGRAVHLSDGVISAEDRKKGGTALSVWLPAGEVYLVPRAGGGEGVVVADRYYHEGDRIDGLRLEIKGGKVVGMTARSGLEGLEKRYEAAGAGRDALGVIDFGINPSVNVPDGGAVNAWSRAGAVTVGIGNNVWAGGDNANDFGIAADVGNATVTVDGREVVKEGKLVGATVASAR